MVVKRQNEGVPLGFLGVRVLEAACIFVGIATLPSVVSLRQSEAGTEALGTAHGLVALHDRIFLLSQSFPLWEFSLGVWLVVRDFSPSPILN
jgi:hypothetical protein